MKTHAERQNPVLKGIKTIISMNKQTLLLSSHWKIEEEERQTASDREGE